MDCFTEEEWDVLLSSISSGRVIPVVGEGLIKNAPDDPTLISIVAAELARQYDLPIEKNEHVSLNQIVTQVWSTRQVPSKTLYDQVNRVLSNLVFPPPHHLTQLATISHFNLFLTTTFAPTFETVMNTVRFGGSRGTHVCKFSIKNWSDLPDWKSNLGPTIYYLLGRAGVVPRSFSIWDADAIDTVLHLHDHLKDGSSLPYLQAALREYDLLFLGVNLTD